MFRRCRICWSAKCSHSSKLPGVSFECTHCFTNVCVLIWLQVACVHLRTGGRCQLCICIFRIENLFGFGAVLDNGRRDLRLWRVWCNWVCSIFSTSKYDLVLPSNFILIVLFLPVHLQFCYDVYVASGNRKTLIGRYWNSFLGSNEKMDRHLHTKECDQLKGAW